MLGCDVSRGVCPDKLMIIQRIQATRYSQLPSKGPEFNPMHWYRFLPVLALAAVSQAQTSSSSLPSSGATTAQAPAAQSSSSSPAAKDTKARQSNSAAERERSGADPLLDLPPLPDTKVTVIGGTVAKMDRVRDRLVLRPFGSKEEMPIVFDLRTKITHNGQPASLKEIRAGSRVYADTMLKGDKVFARNIRIESQSTQGDARGQVVAYDAKNGVLSLREQVSPEPVKLKVTSNTQVEISKAPARITDIRPGALVTVNFVPGANRLGEAQSIRVLANPGETFKFVGKITFVDMRAKRFAIANQSDNETYDISVGPVSSQVARDLREGREAIVSAVFNGQTYEAHEIELAAVAAPQDESNK
jgi:hypothetical protein